MANVTAMRTGSMNGGENMISKQMKFDELRFTISFCQFSIGFIVFYDIMSMREEDMFKD